MIKKAQVGWELGLLIGHSLHDIHRDESLVFILRHVEMKNPDFFVILNFILNPLETAI